MEKALFKPDIAVSLDFGTSGSGYGLILIEPRNDDPRTRQPTIYRSWPSAPPGAPKDLSAVILDASGAVVASGFEAREMWLTRRDAVAAGSMTYHEAFKLVLMAIEDAPLAPGAAGPSNAQADGEAAGISIASDDERIASLIGGYLRHIVEAILEQVEGLGYGADAVRWCATVPAIWTERQKSIMRRALRLAGLPDDDERVILALEPEAAAHEALLRGYKLNVDAGSDDGTADSLRAPGARFMVVDAGGGTVDLTAYQVRRQPNDRDRPRRRRTVRLPPDQRGVREPVSRFSARRRRGGR
jgi:hypothetical protein